MKISKLLLILLWSLALCSYAAAEEPVKPEALPDGQHMYVIERVIPGAGSFSAEKLKSIAQTSCGVLKSMGPQIQWVQSYVTDNKIYCIYIAPDEATVREHASKGGFPANSVSQVRTMIDPTTAE